jgi:hypothetical protein
VSHSSWVCQCFLSGAIRGLPELQNEGTAGSQTSLPHGPPKRKVKKGQFQCNNLFHRRGRLKPRYTINAHGRNNYESADGLKITTSFSWWAEAPSFARRGLLDLRNGVVHVLLKQG